MAATENTALQYVICTAVVCKC